MSAAQAGGGSAGAGGAGGGGATGREGDANNDPLLREVTCEEDRFLIMQVLQAIRSCRREPDLLCTSWTVAPSNTGYIIIAYLPRPDNNSSEWGHSSSRTTTEVTHDDINLIEAVNILRVRVGVVLYQHGPWGLKISITGHRSAVCFSTYDSFCTTRLAVRRTLLLPSVELSAIGGMAKRVLSYFSQAKPTTNNRLLMPPLPPAASGALLQRTCSTAPPSSSRSIARSTAAGASGGAPAQTGVVPPVVPQAGVGLVVATAGHHCNRHEDVDDAEEDYDDNNTNLVAEDLVSEERQQVKKRKREQGGE